MSVKSMLLVSFTLVMLVFAVDADDGSSVITTNDADYLNYGSGYSNSGQTGQIVSSLPGAGEQSPDSLAMFQEFYYLDPGNQASSPVQSGPVQFDLSGNEPTYLVINGQSRPYDPYYVPSNSFWILGRSSWTQYIKCPLNARFSMLALSQGGPVTVVERYPDGYQSVQQYVFYPGYTRLVFIADSVGRHTLTFYTGNQPSNQVNVDVLGYGGSYVSVNVSQTGQPSGGQILIDSQDEGFDPNAGPEGYGDPYGEPGRILIDSAANGFDPTEPVQGEAI
ncbi:MAG TPA: hypothetical protein VF300_05670 [Methanothrix sp.]